MQAAHASEPAQKLYTTKQIADMQTHPHHPQARSEISAHASLLGTLAMAMEMDILHRNALLKQQQSTTKP